MRSMSTSEEVTDAYAQWKHWKPEQFLQFRPAKANYFDWHVGRATGIRGRALQILEVGFGNGEFLGWARTKGHVITGVELNKHLVHLATRAGFDAHSDLTDIDPSLQFDLVVAFDVLEHIPADQIQEFLGALKRLLKERGTMLFRFPNAESPLGCIYQNGDITHVNALGVSKILQLCELNGLSLLHSGDALPLLSLPMRRMPRALLATLIRNSLQFVLGPLLLGHAVRIAANEVVVLGIDHSDRDKNTQTDSKGAV
jgi:2-polyprenyl-3-methyl-5-hydroxy-6-metoxy-1,4-benzoquinol methylase